MTINIVKIIVPFLKKKYFFLFLLILVLLKLFDIWTIKVQKIFLITNNRPQSIELPYKKKSGRVKEFTYHAIIEKHPFLLQSKLNIIPDDCIERLVINNDTVNLSKISPRSLCNRKKGFIINIAPYLKNGNNEVEITILDKGGSYGINILNCKDTIYYVTTTLIFLLFFLSLFFISKYHGYDFGLLLLPIIIVYGYTLLRFEMNIEYYNATWRQLYDLNAPLPFGHRILVPILSRPLVILLGFSIRNSYIFFEFLFNMIIFMGLYHVFKLYFISSVAYFLSNSFFFILPLTFLLKYTWPIFYPYDSASMAFFIGGLYAILKRKWNLFFIITFIGSINRETTIFLLPLLSLVTLSSIRLSKNCLLLIFSAIIFFGTRFFIASIISQNGMQPLHFFIDGKLRVINNLEWIIKDPFTRSIIVLASMGFLPLLYLINRKYIPRELKRIGIWSFSFFFPLMTVGNIYEPRIFGEIIVVLFVPVMAAIFMRFSDHHTYCQPFSEKKEPVIINEEWNERMLKLINIFDKYSWVIFIVLSILFYASFILYMK